MPTIEIPVVTDEQIQAAFVGTGTHRTDLRELLLEGILKVQAGFRNHDSLTQVLLKLELVHERGGATRKGSIFAMEGHTESLARARAAPGQANPLSWLEENCFDLRCLSSPIADTGDYDVHWVVVQHLQGKPAERIVGMGATPAAAVADSKLDPTDPRHSRYAPPTPAYEAEGPGM